jgi:hypothetical protein
LDGDIKLDGRFVTDWTAIALDFDEDYVSRYDVRSFGFFGEW